MYREIRTSGENERALVLVAIFFDDSEEEPERPKMVDEGYKPEGKSKKKVIEQPEKKILKKPATTILKKSATTNLGKAFAKGFATQLERNRQIKEKRANTERHVKALWEKYKKKPGVVDVEWHPRFKKWVKMSQEPVIVDGGVPID